MPARDHGFLSPCAPRSFLASTGLGGRDAAHSIQCPTRLRLPGPRVPGLDTPGGGLRPGPCRVHHSLVEDMRLDMGGTDDVDHAAGLFVAGSGQGSPLPPLDYAPMDRIRCPSIHVSSTCILDTSEPRAMASSAAGTPPAMADASSEEPPSQTVLTTEAQQAGRGVNSGVGLRHQPRPDPPQKRRKRVGCESLTPTRGATQQCVDCESLTPTRGATQQSVDCEPLTPTRGATQQSVDCEPLTPTRGATQQSMDSESLTPTRGATQQSVDCESLTPTQGATQQSVHCETGNLRSG